MADWMALAEANAERVMEKHRAEVAERHTAQERKLKRKADDVARPPEELKRVRKGKGYMKSFFSTMVERTSIQPISPNEEIWKVKCWVSPYFRPFSPLFSQQNFLRNARQAAYTLR
jgi:hypothetical protein